MDFDATVNSVADVLAASTEEDYKDHKPFKMANPAPLRLTLSRPGSRPIASITGTGGLGAKDEYMARGGITRHDLKRPIDVNTRIPQFTTNTPSYSAAGPRSGGSSGGGTGAGGSLGAKKTSHGGGMTVGGPTPSLGVGSLKSSTNKGWIEPHPRNLPRRVANSVIELPLTIIQHIMTFAPVQILDASVVAVCRQWYVAVSTHPVLRSRRFTFLYDHDYDVNGILYYLGWKMNSGIKGETQAASVLKKQQARAPVPPPSSAGSARRNRPSSNNGSTPRRTPAPIVLCNSGESAKRASTASNAKDRIWHNPAVGVNAPVAVASAHVSEQNQMLGANIANRPQPSKNVIVGGRKSSAGLSTSGGSDLRGIICSDGMQRSDRLGGTSRAATLVRTANAPGRISRVDDGSLPDLTNIVSRGVSHFSTENLPYSWAGIDFKEFRLRITHYTIGTSMKAQPAFPLQWELQATYAKPPPVSSCRRRHDPILEEDNVQWGEHTWFVLDKRQGDFFSPEKRSMTFEVKPSVTAARGAVRKIRIVQTGRNAQWGNELVLSGLEVYGNLYK